MADKKVVGWFTMNGKHIPIFEGESKADAVKRSVSKGRKNQPVTEKHVKKLEKDYLDNNRKEWAANREAKRAKSDEEILKAMDKSIDYQRKANDAKYKLDDTLDNHDVIKSAKFKKKSVAEQNEDIKAKQIAQNKEQADKLNNDKKAKQDTESGTKSLTDKLTKAAYDSFNRHPIIPESKLDAIRDDAKSADFNGLFNIAKELKMPVFLGFDSFVEDSYSTGPGVNYEAPAGVLEKAAKNPNIASSLRESIYAELKKRKENIGTYQKLAKNMPEAIAAAKTKMADQLEFLNSKSDGTVFSNPKIVDASSNGKTLRIHYTIDADQSKATDPMTLFNIKHGYQSVRDKREGYVDIKLK